MTFAAIHQFHSGTAAGDAITNQMIALQRILRSEGFVSDLYAQHIAPELADCFTPLAEYEDQPATLMLVHHSIGHSAFELVRAVQAPIVTIFHSITPAHFFADAGLRASVVQGHRQLRELAELSLFGIADSNHNRRQMYDAGFRHVDVLPVRTDYRAWRLIRRTRDTNDWLFVGRVVPNKRQHEIVAAFAHYHHAYGDAHLHLVGDLSYTPYVELVRQQLVEHGIAQHVTLHGKLDDAALLERYRDAGLFVCLSEHEGFGVPLLEAMAADIPVIARASSAVPETMGGAGVLVHDSDPSTIAAIARVVVTDTAVRSRIVAHQSRRLRKLERFDVRGTLSKVAERSAERKEPRPHIQIQGPFETSYSLAILNRYLALALDSRGEDVTIFATEGPGDYVPADDDLAQHPRATELYRAGLRRPFPDVAIRQMYPPRVHDSDGGLTFQYFGWEETGLDPAIAAQFNEHLDGIGAMSHYVRQVLIDAGVAVPIEVVGVGVHEPDPSAADDIDELDDIRSYRFLHVSSAFPRKGVDVLLRAYFEAFSDSDDVTLILKTFPNPHNQVDKVLDKLRHEFDRPPHVCWINRDFTRSQLDTLFRRANAYVHPARGEGFGLPVAEAMLARLPVIATAATGLADFVSPDTAAVIGHSASPADTHLSRPGSMWMEPDRDDLVRELKSAFGEVDAKLRARRVDAARQLVLDNFTWDKVAERWLNLIENVQSARPRSRIAIVSTFNSRCGIAEYSARLYRTHRDWSALRIFADIGAEPVDEPIEGQVVRVWPHHRSGQLDALLRALDETDADLTHIQYNMGFYSVSELERLILHESRRRPTVITLHSTADIELPDRVESLAEVSATLRSCDAVIVHQQSDRVALEEHGVVDTVQVIPIGTETPLYLDRHAARRRHAIPKGALVVGTYGFLLPHKGLLTTLRAIAELQDRAISARLVAMCAVHPDPRSAAHLAEVRAAITEWDLDESVLLVTDYVEHHTSLDYLATADLLAMPYGETQESSSAALRSILPLCKPTVTSDAAIFNDVRDCVVQVPGPVDPSRLADEIERLWLDPTEQLRLSLEIERFCNSTSWAIVSQRTEEVYERAQRAFHDRRRAARER